ncbi:prepilin-type N-terminal cleavage/methylation domain-containing protein [Lysinibacillus capsici]|uniref:prepilin-type N-terminal cleavage/methylation domain-containing protein n=1 Tax=Lysinibacillus capsici TaxID=2115968 RepID=UPI0030821D15|nr:prepilin-type N-terminal cleavage/methylation domain-containing protein [Lysinibacillus capsici]
MERSNQAGITLIETVAVTVIIAIVSLLIYSIIHQSQTNFHKQNNINKDINDAAYALKVITKEIRKNPTKVSTDSLSESELTINKGVTGKELHFVFDKDKNTINKNNVIFATGIQDFKITLKEQIVTIKITSEHGKTISTELYLRRVGT